MKAKILFLAVILFSSTSFMEGVGEEQTLGQKVATFVKEEVTVFQNSLPEGPSEGDEKISDNHRFYLYLASVGVVPQLTFSVPALIKIKVFLSLDISWVRTVPPGWKIKLKRPYPIPP